MSSEKTFQQLSQNSQGEEQLNSNIITLDYGNYQQIWNHLKYTMLQHKKKPKQKQALIDNIINKVSYFLQLLWIQIMPTTILHEQLLGNDLPASFTENNHNILVGTFNKTIQICKQKKSTFIVMLYQNIYMKKQHKAAIKDLDNLYIIPIHNSQKKILKELGLDNQLVKQDPILYIYRFNITDQLIRFAQIQLNVGVESFHQIARQIANQINQYEKIQKQVLQHINNQNVQSE